MDVINNSDSRIFYNILISYVLINSIFFQHIYQVGLRFSDNLKVIHTKPGTFISNHRLDGYM